jgi:hypothetical protein
MHPVSAEAAGILPERHEELATGGELLHPASGVVSQVDVSLVVGGDFGDTFEPWGGGRFVPICLGMARGPASPEYGERDNKD